MSRRFLLWHVAHDLTLSRNMSGTVEPESFAFARAQFGGVEFSATYAAGSLNAWANLSLSRVHGQELLAKPGQFPDAE